jgi:hypothetical protein
MCERLESIEQKINELEIMTLKIKAVNFNNFQSFDYVDTHYDIGGVYKIRNIGYTVILSKSNKCVEFIVIMKRDSIWEKHWQDVDKILEIQQGIYLDLFSGTEFKKKVSVPAYEPSFFKAIGSDDLIIKGKVCKDPKNLKFS